MKFNKNTLIGMTIFIALISYYLLTNTKADKDSNDIVTLTVGIAAGYAPWISINQQGDYEGFDIDVIKQVAVTMNKKLVLKDLGSMTSLLMALDQGSIDAIIWGMSITQDRLQKVAMVHYQGTNITSYPLLFWQQIPAGINNLNDMTGMTICAEPSSSQCKVIEKHSNITILPTDNIDNALLNIQYGKAAAALVEPVIAKKFKAKFPEIQTIDIPLDEQDQVQGVGIVIKKNNDELVEQVETAVTQLKENGFIAESEIRWSL